MRARLPRSAAQRDVGRHVQRTPPYDGHRVELHPMSPLGLTRTGRAPFLLLWNRCSMIASTRALLTCPGLSFPSRTEPCPVPACGRPSRSQTPGAPAPRPRGKGAEPLVPRTPYPSAFGARPSKTQVDHPLRTLDLARFCWPPNQAVRGRPQKPSLCTLTDNPSPTSPPADDAVLKQRRQNHHSQPHPDMPLTPEN